MIAESDTTDTSRPKPATEGTVRCHAVIKPAFDHARIRIGACPADHPARVGVSGVISATEPGTKQYDGSPVSATICANGTDFILATGSTFTIYKK